MRQGIRVTVYSVCAVEQPTGKPLLDVVFCIAAHRLSCLEELRLYIPEREVLKSTATTELCSRHFNWTGITMARNLRVDTIEAPLGSHESGNPNHGLVTEHAHLYLRTIAESCGHGRHPLFDEVEVVDRVAGKFDLVEYLEGDRTQAESLDILKVEIPQKRVLK